MPSRRTAKNIAHRAFLKRQRLLRGIEEEMLFPKRIESFVTTVDRHNLSWWLVCLPIAALYVKVSTHRAPPRAGQTCIIDCSTLTPVDGKLRPEQCRIGSRPFEAYIIPSSNGVPPSCLTTERVKT